jgi:hypothetical protein
LRVTPVEVELSKSDFLQLHKVVDTYCSGTRHAAGEEEKGACSDDEGGEFENEPKLLDANNVFNVDGYMNVEYLPPGEDADVGQTGEPTDFGGEEIADSLGYHEYDVAFEESTLGLQLEQMGEMAVVVGLDGFVAGPFKTTPAVHDFVVAVDGETVLRCSFETIINLIRTSSRPTTIRSVHHSSVSFLQCWVAGGSVVVGGQLIFA